jgi:ribosome biogenesis GTPase
MNLQSIGCPADLLARCAAWCADGLTLGRVSTEHRDSHDVLTELGPVLGKLSGRCRHRVRSAVDRPAVGDWVLMQVPDGGGTAIIQEVLPRRTAFVRKATGVRTEAQMLAANLDVVFVLSSQQAPLGRHAIERYLMLMHPVDVLSVVLLNKSELVEEPLRRADELARALPGLRIHAISALGGQSAGVEDGADVVRAYLDGRLTGAVLGPSGAGKSTLVNRVMGAEAMATAAVRATDGQGRHTTVHRQLLVVPTGGVIIDTPGMRELQPWDEEEGVAANFADIEELALRCHYRSCRHGGESGCAVQAAVAAGELEALRLEDYTMLANEAVALSRTKRDQAHVDEKKRQKRAHRTARMVAEKRSDRNSSFDLSEPDPEDRRRPPED